MKNGILSVNLCRPRLVREHIYFWECRICGHLTMSKRHPEVCPVCGQAQTCFARSDTGRV